MAPSEGHPHLGLSAVLFREWEGFRAVDSGAVWKVDLAKSKSGSAVSGMRGWVGRISMSAFSDCICEMKTQ